MKLFWIGILVGPVVWLIVAKTLWFIFIKQWKAIREWYVGLPIIQWPAMLMLVLATKVIRQKHCEVLRYNSGSGMRVWYSPKVKGFEVDGG